MKKRVETYLLPFHFEAPVYPPPLSPPTVAFMEVQILNQELSAENEELRERTSKEGITKNKLAYQVKIKDKLLS